MAKKRNPSFEILRVVAMFLIVVWHFLMHGVGRSPTASLPTSRRFSTFARWR